MLFELVFNILAVKVVVPWSLPTEKSCDLVADVGFILDSTNSMQRRFDEEKYLIKSLALKMGFGKQGIRASVLTLSNVIDFNIHFKDHRYLNSFYHAVDIIELKESISTRLDRALRFAMDRMFLRTNGARFGVPKVLILITDGTQSKENGMEDPVSVSEEVRKLGISLVVISVGENVNYGQLYSIANGEDNVFSSYQFNEKTAQALINDVSIYLCQNSKYLFFPITLLSK